MGDPVRPTAKDKSAQRATFLELFFDVVFVFALTRISRRAAQALGGSGVDNPHVLMVGLVKVALLLLALWAVWHFTAWTTSLYDPYQGKVQFMVIIALVASMVIGVAISKAYGDRRLAFAVAYVIVHLSRSVLLVISLPDPEQRRLESRILITFGATGALWIVGALLAHGWTVPLWLLALCLEYAAARIGWPVPGLGRSPRSTLYLAGEHLAERYQQFVLIALGEAILVTGRVYSESDFVAGQNVAFALALATSLLIWRIYFHRAGQVLPEAVVKSSHPANFGWRTADSHLIMIGGIVFTAIGNHLTIAHPGGSPQLSWIAVILGGPALFTVGRARFEHEVFGRVSPSRIVVLIVLAALVPMAIHLSALAALGAAVVVLAAAAIADMRRAWGRSPEPPAPPR